MGSSTLYYRPKIALPPLALAAMLGLGGLAAGILGLVYGYLSLYNPFIYVTFLGTMGLAFALGTVSAFGARLGKLRSPVIAGAIGLGVGLLGVYAQWVVYIHALLAKAGKAIWIFAPADVLAVLGRIAEKGVWSIKSLTPSGGVLYALWSIEALAIAGGCAYLCYAMSNDPFCEKCNVWTEEVYANLPFPFCASPKALKERVERGEIDALGVTLLEPGDNFTAAKLHVCPRCEQGFLSAEDVQFVRKKDEVDEQRRYIFRHLRLDPGTLAMARALANAKSGSDSEHGEDELA